MECKGCHSSAFLISSPVLIETLWNVKSFSKIKQVIFNLRINRNIMECKVSYGEEDGSGDIKVLIETLWNVKLSHLLDDMYCLPY